MWIGFHYGYCFGTKEAEDEIENVSGFITVRNTFPKTHTRHTPGSTRLTEEITYRILGKVNNDFLKTNKPKIITFCEH